VKVDHRSVEHIGFEDGERRFRAAGAYNLGAAEGKVLLEHIDGVAVVVDDENRQAAKRLRLRGQRAQDEYRIKPRRRGASLRPLVRRTVRQPTTAIELLAHPRSRAPAATYRGISRESDAYDRQRLARIQDVPP